MMETLLAHEESREFLEAQNTVLIQEAARLDKRGEESHHQIENLNRALESRDRLLITIARWLSRPLPALCAHLDDFMDDERLVPVRDEFESCSDHISAIRRLSRGLDEIAGFLQMQVVLRPETLDLVTVARQAVVDVREEDGGTEFEVEFIGAERVEGTWDRLRLARLFKSLVRTSRDQGYGGKVMIGVTDLKNWARIQVEFHQPAASSGVDLNSSHESAERYRRPVDESDYERLGVALWPSRELARVMGGTLGVSTWADARVVFTIDLPKLGPTSRRDGKSPTREAGYQ
jgi:light-regulated signal transduction histidine kinase (bacteriophytochrome)